MFQVHHLQVTHGRMAYIDEGEGHTLLFIHGLPTSKFIWYDIINHMHDYRCIAIDLLDYGDSEKINRHISHKQRAENIINFIEKLNLQEITMIAHDLGSSVAIDVMGLNPAYFSKLIIMSPPVYPDFIEPAIVKLVRRKFIGKFLVSVFKSLMFSIGIKQGMTRRNKYTNQTKKHLLSPFLGKDGTLALLRVLRWGSPNPVFLDYPKIIKNISIPTLLIIGANDPYIPRDQITRMHENIVNSTLEIIPEASHFITLDFSKEISHIILNFLSN
ncbi:MAG: alpha/beta hydrolase [Candidatus Heimdallarchaeota archaeon]|nr:alpha/beta hydrolase [Candidatus Heimdallarchaeota archaeon]